MTTQEKTDQLDKIALEIQAFKSLEIAKNANHPVPGEGNPDTQAMFIGEAPGFHEDQVGRPFVGAAGRLLEKSLKEIGLKREEVYITNIVKFRPPENRDPLPEEIEACRDWLDRQISIIRPQIIITLGRFSMAKFLFSQSISKIHGQPRRIVWNPPSYSEPLSLVIFPMFHPAAALRAGQTMSYFLSDFHKLSDILKEKDSLSPPGPEALQVTKPTQSSLF